MSNLSLPRHKVPAGMDMKRAREMIRLHKDDPFCEPNNGVMRPAVFDQFAAVAVFGDELPPAGWVELVCSEFAARVFVRNVPAGADRGQA
jgi:hypothetical protein